MLQHFQSNSRQDSSRATRFNPGAGAAEQLEDYLDHALAETVGLVPYARRQELRREMGDHLLSLADAYEELGAEPADAMRQALEQFGDPRVIGRQWYEAWEPRLQPRGNLWRAALPAALGIAPITIAGWLMALLTPDALIFGSRAHYLLPWVLAACLFAGFRPGRFRAAGACLAISGFAAVTGLSFLLLGEAPQQQAWLNLTGLQILTWIPVGTLAADVAGWAWERGEQSRRRAWR